MYGWASLPLRIGLGIMFIAHGMQKVFGAFGGSGIGGFEVLLNDLGFTMPLFWAYFAAYTELLGGLCLLLGIFTRIAASALFILIVVAGVTVHLNSGFFANNNGIEYPLVIASATLSLALLGSGRYALSHRF
ncbi:MAG: DoxX family protein [Chlamydiota bacterium]